MTEKSGCIICGKPLDYSIGQEQLECYICGGSFTAEVCCTDGHFLCDHCHSAGANEIIQKYCSETSLTDPIEMAEKLMHFPQLKMHGPEHHYLVPAVLLASYYNLRGDERGKIKKLNLARQRSEMVPGGFCGSHGNCGAGVGTGIFFSLTTDTTPLSGNTWQLSNLLTGNCLIKIALQGGPRCCKRDTFTAIKEAVQFIGEHLDIHVPVKEEIICSFHHMNRECLKTECLYYPG